MTNIPYSMKTMDSKTWQENCDRGVENSCQKLDKALQKSDDELLNEWANSEDVLMVENDIKDRETETLKKINHAESEIQMYKEDLDETNFDWYNALYAVAVVSYDLISHLTILGIEFWSLFFGSSKKRMIILVVIFIPFLIYYDRITQTEFERQYAKAHREKLPGGKVKLTFEDEFHVTMAFIWVIYKHIGFIVYLIMVYFVHVPQGWSKWFLNQT